MPACWPRTSPGVTPPDPNLVVARCSFSCHGPGSRRWTHPSPQTPNLDVGRSSAHMTAAGQIGGTLSNAARPSIGN